MEVRESFPNPLSSSLRIIYKFAQIYDVVYFNYSIQSMVGIGGFNSWWFSGGLRHLKAYLQVFFLFRLFAHHLNWELLAVGGFRMRLMGRLNRSFDSRTLFDRNFHRENVEGHGGVGG